MVFEAEVVGMSLAAELIMSEASVNTATIRVDSQAAIRATINMWGSSGQHLVDRAHEQIAAV